MAFKAPNINGPRFRRKCKSLLTLELFENFKKAHPTHVITYEQFKSIILKCSYKMWNAVINERDGIELPIGGVVFIGSTKIYKRNNYDIIASIKANAPIKHRNYETDGFVGKIYYTRRIAKVSSRDVNMWGFTGHRDFKRAMAKIYPKTWQKFSSLASPHRVNNEYIKNRNKSLSIKRTEKESINYNEFDL